MQDLISMMNALHRPRLLIRAARLGADEYRRDRHLHRILGYGALPRSGPAMLRLMELEQIANDMRLSSDAGYSLTRHLDILIALIGESRVLRATMVQQDERLAVSAL